MAWASRQSATKTPAPSIIRPMLTKSTVFNFLLLILYMGISLKRLTHVCGNGSPEKEEQEGGSSEVWVKLLRLFQHFCFRFAGLQFVDQFEGFPHLLRVANLNYLAANFGPFHEFLQFLFVRSVPTLAHTKDVHLDVLVVNGFTQHLSAVLID